MILPWEAELLRVYVGESDMSDGMPLYERIVYEARQRGMAGATVLRGCMGFGASSRVRPNGDTLSNDTPIVIEIVDKPERIRALMVELQQMLKGGLLTLQTVRVVTYRPEQEPSLG